MNMFHLGKKSCPLSVIGRCLLYRGCFFKEMTIIIIIIIIITLFTVGLKYNSSNLN